MVIGKNNTGKTSILSVLDKFLKNEKPKFNFEDFNINFKKELEDSIIANTEKKDYKAKGIKLKLFIEYSETCNLENISRVMMDLDPENNFVVLGFEYVLLFDRYKKIREDYREFKTNEEAKQKDNPNYNPKSISDFLTQKHADYFKPQKKSIEIDKMMKINEENFIDLENEKISIKDIINFKYIGAKREVANKEADKTLSVQTSMIYEKTEASSDQSQAVEDFKDKLSDTDSHLSTIYEDLFKPIIKKVGTFGGMKLNESTIEIISTLQHRDLLKGNTTVVYKHDDGNKLPEHYNGLGYMNLISMIFQIEILVQDFKRKKDEKPADINLLFIEEPEAHTHPQMQYVFIKNIKNLLQEGFQREDGENRKLQTIISTHSSHIVADSDFVDIKYLQREINTNSVVAKNLKDLEKKYTKPSQYQFLTQYLTLNRAEMFFADKAILIEGDTERMLIPAIMKKLDLEAHDENGTDLPLLSQNISIAEVGAYSHIFDEFIEFLGIKTLIVTDLDAVDNNDKKCEVVKGVSYSNTALTHFFNKPTLEKLKGYSMQNKTFNKVNGNWKNESNGKLCIVYQTAENGYNARSFEDAFIHLNRDFVKDNKEDFRGLQNRDDFDESTNSAYYLAERCIKKKTHFALDILFHSSEKFSNWHIPKYIEEGLLWLKED